MRVQNSSLTIRTFIATSILLTGCIANFGQIKANGTVNATADTKIDTTVNASGSVATTSTPVATPTPGPGTLYVRHVAKLSGPDSTMGHYNMGETRAICL